MKFGYNNKIIPSVLFTTFPQLTIYNMLSWSMHIDHLTTKLSTACYVIRFITPLISHETLLLIYYSLFTVMNYGIFWRNSCHNIQIFQMQKRVIRIITGCGSKDSCRILFKKLKMLPLISQHILPQLIFVVNNRDQFLINSEIHNINTTHSSNLHLTSAKLYVY